ncbi:tetratricopeptide repeat protein [Devosia sp.]|uniref:tetratricopeptide repeat protein n=1 Tax=Devosia sp. TaxID=1871048 RepID=UPI001AFDB666|nr:tetratricopeptide repeat protein [Devosia sp.]MBO9587047.1 sel1 repeat family protein [Devosia sp.]
MTVVLPDCARAALETASAQGDPAAKVELAQELLKAGMPGGAESAVRLLTGVAERGDGWAAVLLANLYRQGEAVEQDGAKVVALLEPLAKGGNAGALTGLGELYLTGARNMPKDVPLAAEYFERAAATGDLWGKFQLALLLIDGNGVDRDLEQAVELLEEVSKAGDPWVLITLGDLYAGGLVPPAEKAIPYFEKAAATGNTAALTRLAQAYQTGLGTEAADPAKSREFWEAAVAKGDSFAGINLALLLLDDGGRVAVDRAVKLLDAGAARGEAWPATILADLLVRGEKVPQDAQRAVALLAPLADEGSAAAQVALSDIYAKGAGDVIADPSRAFALVDAAYKQGEAQAASRLGFMLVRGEGTKQDISRGMGLLDQAVSRSTDPWLAIDVGALLAAGDVVPVDGDRAIAMFKKAADLGSAAGLFRLGISYRDGVGDVEPDPVMARTYLGRAADMGDNASRVTLAQMLLASDVRADVDKGVILLEAAAEEHDAWGTTSLAALLLEGRVLPKDGERVRALLEPLAEEGSAAALAMLGDLYVKGADPIAADPPVGRGYYEKAAALGELGAKNKLGLMLLAGEAGDVGRGLQLLREVAEAGDGWAKIQLGDALTQGGAVDVDAVAARDYYQRALDQGIAAGAVKLGLLYLNGAGTLRPDPVKAAEFFEAAAADGDDLARIQLALMHFEGRGVARDVAQSLTLLGDAAQDSAWANGILGGYYADGRFGEPDYAKARDYFDRAVALGDASGSFRFGGLLSSGPLAKEHREEGLELVRGAVSQGIPGAAVEMARLEMMGVAGAGGGKAAEQRLLAEVKRENPAALRLLLQLYRAGGGGLSPSIAKAKASLDQYGGLLQPDAATFESMALQAAGPPTLDAMQAVGDSFGKLGAGDVTQAVQMLFWSNKNAYVYVLQQQLKKAERYGGPLDGRLTRGTIAALNAACRESSSETRVCSMGPLTPDYAVMMSKQIAGFDMGVAVN